MDKKTKPHHRWEDLDADEAGREQRRLFMRRAIDLAQEKMDENGGGPFGAVVVRRGKIVGEGWDSVFATNDPTAHAEIVAIRAASSALGNHNLEGCEIYTSCEPCPMCLSALYWAGVDRVFYAGIREDAVSAGFDTDMLYREMAQPIEKRSMPSFMMLRDESRIVMGLWDRKKDKSTY